MRIAAEAPHAHPITADAIAAAILGEVRADGPPPFLPGAARDPRSERLTRPAATAARAFAWDFRNVRALLRSAWSACCPNAGPDQGTANP